MARTPTSESDSRRHWREVDDLRGQLRAKLHELADLRADYEMLVNTHENLGAIVFGYLEAIDLRAHMIHESMLDEVDRSEKEMAGWDAAFDEVAENIQCYRETMASLVGFEGTPLNG